MVENNLDRVQADEHDRSHDVYTLANIITLLRLMMVPFAFDLLISNRNDNWAFVLFALAASTDWFDGQIARKTGTVTELGKAIDPIVDRLLIAAGVLGLYIVGRLPLWIVILLLARDAILLAGAMFLAIRRIAPVRVVYIGKVTTMLLLAGFSGLMLGWPKAPGLGLIDSRYLPGFGSDPAIIWIWFVYVGIVTSVITAVTYVSLAVSRVRQHAA